MVMNLVGRPVDERHGSIAGTTPENLKGVGMPCQLFAIAAPELVPTLRIVAEPRPQIGGGRNFLEPLVQLGLCLAKAARPQAIYEDSRAVCSFGRVIRALESEVRSGAVAMDDSRDLRKLVIGQAAYFALELDFGTKSFEVAVDHRDGLLSALSQVGDRTIAGFD